jgi:SAM-dependent methyltransferase
LSRLFGHLRRLPSRLAGPRAAAWWLGRFGGGGLLQPATVTSPERHPELFDSVGELLAELASPAILSFGCSTGEEVFSLAQRFPFATVRGIDINPACIRAARHRLAAHPDPRLGFVRAASASSEAPHSYDAIFALSVLRHGRLDAEAPDDCSAILPFARFAAAVAALDACLKPGGLLIVWGSHFRFADLPLAIGYEVILSRAAKSRTPVYGPDNRRLAYCGTEDIIFRKLSARSL